MSGSRHLPQQGPDQRAELQFSMPPNVVLFDVDHPQALIDAKVLASVWGVGVQRIYKRIKNGDFDFLRPQVAVTGPRQFSGVLLAQSARYSTSSKRSMASKRPTRSQARRKTRAWSSLRPFGFGEWLYDA